MSLACLRYAIVTRSILDTGTVQVPVSRFRVGVMVPVTTLLGAGDEPGLLDGTIPIPADMARSLAGNQDTWYRVLTDPVTGAFLPARQERYQPTTGMLEHLRHRHATCAVPGCARPTSRAAECDHIIEYDHSDPGRGGPTVVENLHLLCWQHHLAKTLGHLDPVRLPDQGQGHGPGITRWTLRDGTSVDVCDDTDLFTPRIAADLTEHWALHQRLQRQREHDHERAGGDPDGTGRDPGGAGEERDRAGGSRTPSPDSHEADHHHDRYPDGYRMEGEGPDAPGGHPPPPDDPGPPPF